MKFPFSFIITYRHSMDRIYNLRRVIDWLNGYKMCQIILIEQDNHSKIEEFNLDVNKHIFIENNGSFNKSWGFNVGMKYVQSDIVVFGDADIIMDPTEFWESLKMLNEYECVNPYSRVIDLDITESRLSMGDMVKIDREGRGETDIQKVPLAGGIICFRTSSVEKIGGWNENFRGWGGEDDFQTVKIEKMLKYIELTYKSYHLHHEKSMIKRDEYDNNLRLLNNAKSWSDSDMFKYIKSIRSIGDKNKYENETLYNN